MAMITSCPTSARVSCDRFDFDSRSRSFQVKQILDHHNDDFYKTDTPIDYVLCHRETLFEACMSTGLDTLGQVFATTCVTIIEELMQQCSTDLIKMIDFFDTQEQKAHDHVKISMGGEAQVTLFSQPVPWIPV